MAQANIDALTTQIATIKESLRIKNQSLANIDPKYKMNEAYIAKLNDEISALNSQLATAENELTSTTKPATVSSKPGSTGITQPIKSTPYDDDGNLNPGWKINNETGEPYYIGATKPEPQQYAEWDSPPPTSDVKTTTTTDNTPFVTDGGWPAIYNLNKDIIKNPDLIYPGQVLQMPGGGTYTVAKGDTLTWIAQGKGKGTYSRETTTTIPAAPVGTTTGLTTPDKKPVLQRNDFKQKEDWRVRISLAPHADYLYKASKDESDILYPLKETDGVIFPYTPSVTLNYNANYDGTELTHTNYKIYQYKNSEVAAVNITGVFTAQDTAEANYLLAAMHFFRSATKMFYGQDQNPPNGVPPPLCYLSGYGAFQFDNHPLVITGFQLTLPDDVDYIRAGQGLTVYTAGQVSATKDAPKTGLLDSIKARLRGSNLNKGGMSNAPSFKSLSNQKATYVPTKVQFVISCLPIVTRNDISHNFSLAKYATGELLRGSKRNTGGGGIW